MAARISQAGTVAVTTGTPKGRPSQLGAVAITQGTPRARASQAGVIVVYGSQLTATAVVSQVGLAAIYPLASPATSNPAALLCGL
jgi:hypothetical protein